MDVPGVGKIAIDQGAGGTGLDRLDDKMPTAWEETTGTSLGTGIQTVTGVGGVTNIEYTVSADMLPDGLTAHLAFSPRAGGSAANDKASGGDSGGTGSGYDIVLGHTGLVDGLDVFAGFSRIEQPGTDGTDGDRTQYAAGATYAMGSVTVGYQYTRDNKQSAVAGDVTSYYENNAYGISFNINDNFSISYGVHKSDRVKNNTTNAEAEAESLQLAYTMGGMSIKLAETQVDNGNYNSATTVNDREATTVALSLAF
jgi:hypothetical protein